MDDLYRQYSELCRRLEYAMILKNESERLVIILQEQLQELNIKLTYLEGVRK